MDSKIEVNEADSAMLGHQLSMIAALMQAVDWDYFEAAEKALHEAASLYDSGAVLNRAYTPEKGDLMRAQVAAMRKLREYREQLIQIDILKAKTVSAQTVLKNMADARSAMASFNDMAKQPASQWLNFDIVLPAGTGGRKTPIWGVTPKAGGNRLGVVSWYGPWRKYTYTPAENTVYDAACLHDIAAFCEWLMAERREPA